LVEPTNEDFLVIRCDSVVPLGAGGTPALVSAADLASPDLASPASDIINSAEKSESESDISTKVRECSKSPTASDSESETSTTI
jgi:hypothetical protein